MAFVARRSSDGTVVDRQQVSSRGTVRPLSQSDISDEDSESGYTNRTYGAPTVRYVGQGDDQDAVEPQPETKSQAGEDFGDADNLQFEDSLEDNADISDSETDSILSFCKELDEDEANDALLSGMVSFAGGKPKAVDEVEAEDVDQRDMGMNKGDEAAATDTETVMNFDAQSLSSFGSCTPTVTQRGEAVDNLDNISGRTFFKQDELDSISSKTFFKEDNLDKLDALSSRTFHKQASLKDKRKHTPSYHEADLGQMSSRTYDLSNSGSNRIHDGSSMSTCSWSDMYRGALQPADGRSRVVPSLSLASANSNSSTYCKQLEETKERQGFEEWKAQKEAQKQKNLLAAKQERKKREAEAALQQVRAQERFEEWRRRKEQQQQQQQQKQKKASAASAPGSGSVSGSSAGPARKVLPPELTQKRLQEWERVKKEQQQLERERLRRLQSNKQKLEDERRQRSQGAWQNWMKHVDKRPKPVPLNQGFDTLRGTISNIYINPVQWVSNIDPQDAGRSR
ncbi:uncharacterized protein LOC122625823 [Drosophila teissieri]|uniref:uncharacterized protein LOC122625823 n=1 Tax=Drosophila teissieri TaxID=7243 RepID=UPI001CB9DEEF|nr:uncharacterized protein LOC122625823 [Drosophila teissieri]